MDQGSSVSEVDGARLIHKFEVRAMTMTMEWPICFAGAWLRRRLMMRVGMHFLVISWRGRCCLLEKITEHRNCVVI